MNFSPQAAFDYIKGKINDFYLKGEMLRQQETAIQQLIVKLAENQMDSSQAYQISMEIEDDLNGWQRIANKLTPILHVFGYNDPYNQPSVGIDPLTLTAMAAVLIAVAALMYAWYNSQRIDAHNTAIRTIAANVPMSPQDQQIIEQATTYPSFFSSLFSGFGTLGNYLIIGGAIYLGILLLRK